jgi:hypothetical protein
MRVLISVGGVASLDRRFERIAVRERRRSWGPAGPTRCVEDAVCDAGGGLDAAQDWVTRGDGRKARGAPRPSCATVRVFPRLIDVLEIVGGQHGINRELFTGERGILRLFDAVRLTLARYLSGLVR